MKERLVLIGNGMAGIRTLEELLELTPDKYNITVFGAEPYGNYNRILLSPVLAADKTIDEIMLNDWQWYRDQNITLHTGHDKSITHIDRIKRAVTTQDGLSVSYDRLIVATGSNPFMLPIPGSDLDGIIGFRDIHDVNTMLEATKNYKKAVVIGGGLLGLEAANGLMKQGMEVTVIHLMGTLMERQLDKPAALLLKKHLEEKGLNFLLDTQTDSILARNDGASQRVGAVKLQNGQIVEADLVVMAVGIRPNIALAQEAGLHCERGIVVNDTMQTFDPSIYAVGECVQHRGGLYGLVAPLFEQAKVCANHLAEMGYARYEGSITSTKLKVTGIDLFSAGNFHSDEQSEDIVYQDSQEGVYKKLCIRDNKIQGAVLYGDTIDGSWYFQLMKDQTDISDMRSNLLFGQAHLGDSGHGEADRVAMMTDDAEVCGCNGVCKGTITKAIVDKKLFTLDDVRSHTKASSSCGSCTALVEQIISSTLGGEYSDSPEHKPLCKCTDHPHDHVRRTILDQQLKTIPDVMHFMDWKQTDGCHICRPALNYYLLCAWNGDYQDSPESRFINERAHANIQKDGSYSVVPRMWGGITSPKELRAIADTAEKFEVKTLKVTGGQRIDLFGLSRHQLPEVWSDLSAAGLVSGHAYGKSLRTVKTCVGSEWCRFGTQDATTMGIKLEQLTWGSWMPHKFKMAVSGCPRNCSEATIKDFGVVAVDSGWELHIGGNGGIKVRVTDFLCKVSTEEEVLEYSGAFIQMYREEAHYLERTAPWLERVGLSHVKQRLVDNDEERKVLFERFKESQKSSQDDPWSERAKGHAQHQFNHLKTLGEAL